MELAKKCLDKEMNSILDKIIASENILEEDRSSLHFEYIEELKENVLELRRAKIILELYSVEDLSDKGHKKLFNWNNVITAGFPSSGSNNSDKMEIWCTGNVVWHIDETYE